MIGQRIRQLRKEKYWTQKELGERAGIEPKNIGGYETGRLKANRKTLEKFAQAFEMTLEELTKESLVAESQKKNEDPELAQLMGELFALPEADRSHLKWMISVALRNHKVQSAMAS